MHVQVTTLSLRSVILPTMLLLLLLPPACQPVLALRADRKPCSPSTGNFFHEALLGKALSKPHQMHDTTHSTSQGPKSAIEEVSSHMV
jgi:hypothetical protein